MEEESKISFWKQLKISIWGLEDYKKIAVQKISRTIGYLAILMIIFSTVLSLILTYQFSQQAVNFREYIQNEIAELKFEDGKLIVKPKEGETIEIDNNKEASYKIIIDTKDLSKENEESYSKEIQKYASGLAILQDKIIVKTSMTKIPTTILLNDVFEQYNIVKIQKEDIINLISGTKLYSVCGGLFITFLIYLFIITISVTLIDALLYSAIAYITSVFTKMPLKYTACYNIAIHALSLPIILNIIYASIKMLTGFNIKYFDIMYTAITCIYIIASIMIIKADVIKQQMELSKVIMEQEKIKKEMKEKEQEEEEERLRQERDKEKEKQRKKEKEESQKKDNGPQPEANIK